MTLVLDAGRPMLDRSNVLKQKTRPQTIRIHKDIGEDRAEDIVYSYRCVVLRRIASSGRYLQVVISAVLFVFMFPLVLLFTIKFHAFHECHNEETRLMK